MSAPPSANSARGNKVCAACEKEWDRWKSDCSGFLRTVAADLGFTLTGQANDIIGEMGRSPWTAFGKDAEKAVQYAGKDYFVIAGLKALPHGHVVVIVPGPSIPYPTGYWGTFGGTGRKNTTINWAWTHADLKKVEFFGRKL